MKDMYNVGQMLLDALRNVGDFFLQHPFGDFVAEQGLEGAWADALDQPLIAYVLGGGLIVFLAWKLVCFIIPS